MASTFKSFTLSNVGATAQSAYTAPASTTTILTALSVANTTTGSITATVNFVKSGSTPTALLYKTTFSGGVPIILSGGDQRVVLQTGDAITVSGSATSCLDVVGGILELT